MVELRYISSATSNQVIGQVGIVPTADFIVSTLPALLLQMSCPRQLVLHLTPSARPGAIISRDAVHAAVQGAARVGERGGGHFGGKVGRETHGG